MSVNHRQGERCPTPNLSRIGGSPISASVGNAGANRKADVNTIQQMLNSVPPEQGGPSPKLAQDGLIGPKTIAAITSFQKRRLGWSDGRVDVSDKTMGALLVHVATLPPGQVGLKKGLKDFEHPDWWGPSVVDTAVKQTKEIEPLLGNLRWRLTRQSDDMAALLGKHFSNPGETVEDADFEFVRQIAREMHVYMARASMGGQIRAAGVFQYSQSYPDNSKDALGFTWWGGAHGPLGGGLFKEDDGTMWKMNEGQTIWVTDLYAIERDTEQLLVILHEFCHFVGDTHGRAGAVNDNGYAFEPIMMYLNKNAKLHNAESLALFYFECCFGTQRMLSMPRVNMVRPMLDRFPKVSVDGTIDRGPKKTWPTI